LIPDLERVFTIAGFTPKSKNDIKLTAFETTSASRKDPDSIYLLPRLASKRFLSVLAGKTMKLLFQHFLL